MKTVARLPADHLYIFKPDSILLIQRSRTEIKNGFSVYRGRLPILAPDPPRNGGTARSRFYRHDPFARVRTPPRFYAAPSQCHLSRYLLCRASNFYIQHIRVTYSDARLAALTIKNRYERRRKLNVRHVTFTRARTDKNACVYSHPGDIALRAEFKWSRLFLCAGSTLPPAEVSRALIRTRGIFRLSKRLVGSGRNLPSENFRRTSILNSRPSLRILSLRIPRSMPGREPGTKNNRLSRKLIFAHCRSRHRVRERREH